MSGFNRNSYIIMTMRLFLHFKACQDFTTSLWGASFIFLTDIVCVELSRKRVVWSQKNSGEGELSYFSPHFHTIVSWSGWEADDSVDRGIWYLYSPPKYPHITGDSLKRMVRHSHTCMCICYLQLFIILKWCPSVIISSVLCISLHSSGIRMKVLLKSFWQRRQSFPFSLLTSVTMMKNWIIWNTYKAQ